jgi:hypothetical protein
MDNAITKSQQHEAIPARVESATLISVIERAATNPDVDIEKMERLLEMHERITAKAAEQAFNSAMVQAQSEMRRISTDAENKQTRSRYATYGALDRALRPVYTAHGFAVSFDTEPGAPDTVTVVAHVSHRDGYTRTYRVQMPADGKGAKGGDVMTKTHATGAAMSYGSRYLLKLIFNVAVGEDDDDGNLGAQVHISDDQIANLEALLSEVGADRSGFYKYFGIEAMSEMPESRYSVAVAMLRQKGRQS